MGFLRACGASIPALALIAACGSDPSPGGSQGAGAGGDGQGGGGQGGDGQGGDGGGGGAPTFCEPGSTISCYTGPLGTVGVGVCAPGVQTCAPDGMSYEPACVGEVLPQPKNCATPEIDEACDGNPGPCADPPLFAALYGDGARQEGHAVASDPAGNILLAGVYEGAPDFGAGPLGPGAMFLVKLDPAGNALWQRAFTTGWPPSVLSDAQGNVVVYGQFSGTLDLGGGPISAGAGDALFLAKFDPDGQHLFSKPFPLGGNVDPFRYLAGIGPAGEIAIAGGFDGTIDLGGGPLMSAGQLDVFVARFDVDGNHLWSARFGGAGDQLGAAVAVDAAGGLVVAGGFQGDIDFGNGPILSMGDHDVFVAQLDATGAPVWSQRFGGAGSSDIATSVAVAPSGEIFLAGAASDPFDLGGGEHQTQPAESFCFLAKLDSGGGYLWSKGYGCHLNMFVPIGPRVVTDPSGNALMTSAFRGITDLGLGVVWSQDADAFAVKVGAAGDPLWVKTFSSDGYDLGFGIASDPAGNALVAGVADGDMDLGGGLLTGHGDFDIYLAKLAP